MKNYIQEAIRTESSEAPEHILGGMELAGLMERVIDVGETADLFKKSCFYDGNLERLAPADKKDLRHVADTLGAEYAGPVNARLLHAGLGMLTEAVEFLEALHKAACSGDSIDAVNLAEELGDQFWYQAIAADELDTTFEAEQERNIAKLRKRYPNKFEQERANNRDLAEERRVLEK